MVWKKWPLLPIAILHTVGIVLGWLLTAPLHILFALAFPLLLLALLWSHARPFALCPLVVLTGWINFTERTALLSPRDLRALLPQAEQIRVRGAVSDAPQHHLHLQRDKEYESTTAQLDVTAICLPDHDWQPASGRIVTSTKGSLPDTFFKGVSVEIDGVIGPPERPVAEGLFDYPAYLRHLGVYHQLHINNTDSWRVLSSPAHPPLAERFSAWARQALARGLPVEDQTLRLEWALTLGWKGVLTEDVSEPFIRASTYHIFAVDGLRIAIVSGIIIALLRVLTVPRMWCGLIALPVILLYAHLTGWPASAVRAIVMAGIVFAGWFLNRPLNHVNSLSLAALLILVYEPRQLFQAGFQLSFFVVLCIILIMPFFEKLGKRLLQVDPLLPNELRPAWQQWLRKAAQVVLDLFLASVAAWLGSIPLVAYYFHLVTPLSGLANVLAIPLCGLVLISNLSSLLLAAWFPFGSEIFNHAAWFLMRGIQITSQWSANWPAAYFYLSMPSLFTIIVYYVVLVTVLTGWAFKEKWRVWKISALALLSAAWFGWVIHAHSATQLTILPVGGGHVVYASFRGGGSDWLIDCGDESHVDIITKPFLRAQGVNRLPNFLLTHGENLYTDGATFTCDLFRPRKIYSSAIAFRSPRYREFQNDPHFKSVRQPPLKLGDHAGPWTVLHPAAEDHFPKGEDNALCLQTEIHGVHVLLLSGLGRAGQRALLERTNDLRADIVVAGIPADAEPLGDMLLATIQPSVVIIADTQRPATHHASRTLRDRLSRCGIPVLYESDTGAVTLAIRGKRWDLHAMDGTHLSWSLDLLRPASSTKPPTHDSPAAP